MTTESKTLKDVQYIFSSCLFLLGEKKRRVEEPLYPTAEIN